MQELGAALLLQPYVGVKAAALLMLHGWAIPLAERLLSAHSDTEWPI